MLIISTEHFIIIIRLYVNPNFNLEVNNMKKRIFAIFSAVIILLSAVSCSKSAYDYDAGYFPKEEAEVANGYYASSVSEDYALDEMSYGSSEIDVPSSTETKADEQNDLSERKIIKNADLNFQTKEYDAFLESLNQTIKANGGYIESSDMNGGGVNSYNYYRSANIKVRVPADKYNAFMDTVLTLGSVTHKNEYINDVTLRYVDIESRIRAYETEYDALMDLLAEAESIDYIIQLRQRISEIQYELESYKSQIRKYDDLISYSTISIYVSEVRVEQVSVQKQTFGERIKTGLEETFYDLGEDLENFSVWFIVNLPYILIWVAVNVAIVFIIIGIVKGSKKKKAKKKAAAEAKANNEKK